MAKVAFDSRTTLAGLEERHRILKKQLAFLERRAFMTPTEQREAMDLKKRKLATKDAIAALRSLHNIN